MKRDGCMIALYTSVISFPLTVIPFSLWRNFCFLYKKRSFSLGGNCRNLLRKLLFPNAETGVFNKRKCKKTVSCS